VKIKALFLLCFVLLVSSRLLAQGNCTPEKAEVDKLEQWTSFDRDHGNATLATNKSKLADAIKSLDRCQHRVHTTDIGDDGQIVTVGSETCYKPREYGRYVNTGASVKVKEIFESKADFETMYKKVSDTKAVVDEVATALFSACFDLGTGKISAADYQKSRQVYEQLLTDSLKPPVKRVSRSSETHTDSIDVSCDEVQKGETPVLSLGKNPQDVTPTSAWVEISNIRSHNAREVEKRDANNVLTGIQATGEIAGLNSQHLPLGITNCPGGGHARLTLNVTWTEEVPATQ
jgi:hypothetical protein